MTDQPADPRIDPLWIPHRIDLDANEFEFVHWPRDRQRDATFLTHEYMEPRQGRLRVAADPIRPADAARVGPLHFVFHSAFCGSTLLARMLDIPGSAMALKEPAILDDLAGLRRRGVPKDRLARLLAATLGWLSRPLAEGEITVAKPGNRVNVLIADILDQRPESRALFMYSALPDFLRSVAKRGLWGRRWARGLYLALAPDSSIDPGFDRHEVLQQTDLQIAATAWLMHQAQFAALADRFGPARVRTLDAQTLMTRPDPTLQAVSNHFGLALSAEMVAEIVSGPVLRRNSKAADKPFDAANQQSANQRADAAHGEEISMVARWVEAVAAHGAIPMTLPCSLLDHN